MKVLIIIPAYNEEENILHTIRDIQNAGTPVDYVVINDCSTDRTEKLLRDSGAVYLDLPVNLGIGGGVQTGYRYAMEHDYDVAVQFDGDGQHDARYIKKLIAPIERGEADVVVGSRYLEKRGFQSSSLRRFGILFLSTLLRILCGVRVRDVTSGMRAVNRGLICQFANDYAQDYPEPEAILAAGMRGARIQEVPVEMRERAGGVSSINAVKAVYYMVKVSLALILERFFLRKQVTEG